MTGGQIVAILMPLFAVIFSALLMKVVFLKYQPAMPTVSKSEDRPQKSGPAADEAVDESVKAMTEILQDKWAAEAWSVLAPAEPASKALSDEERVSLRTAMSARLAAANVQLLAETNAGFYRALMDSITEQARNVARRTSESREPRDAPEPKVPKPS
jgi:hypothetical protein